MRRARLDDMLGGWFVGDFTPTVLPTQAVEVAVKRYAAGATERRHHHKRAAEITLIIDGQIRMGAERLRPGDIILLEPGEVSDFEASTAATVVAVKVPGVKNDKYSDPDARPT